MPAVSPSSASTRNLVPFAPPAFQGSLTARAERTPAGVLVFDYFLETDTSRLRIPERHAPDRTDELWKHTCFEAFACRMPDERDPFSFRAAHAAGLIPGEYREMNFSPSTQWAMYTFKR